jgi:cytochrome c oxidase subunit 3
MGKPWTTEGLIDELPEAEALSPARTGLWAFLAVVTSLFGLFISAYHMRAEYPDWVQLKDPGLLWLNTVLLVLTSVGFQYARNAAEAGRLEQMRAGLTVGGVLTLAFLAGQYTAWEQLQQAGYFLADNPSYAFFYLLTGVHGLHLVGGLWVWAKMTLKVWRGFDAQDVVEVGRVRLSVELCTVYWHYLLLVWVVLFGLLLTT